MELKKFECENLDVEKLADVLKSANKVSQSVILELGDDKFSIQSALETKSATKFTSVYTKEILSSDDDVPDILLPFSDSRNLKKALKLFTQSAENVVTIQYADFSEDLSVVDNITINEGNGTLVINIKCTDIGDVIYLEDDIKSGLTEETTAIGSFEINEMTLKKAIDMFSLDSDYASTVSLVSRESDIFLVGHNYEYKICEFYDGGEVELTFKKAYLDFVEKEFSDIFLHDNRIVIKSKDTDTQTVIAVSEEVDEDYM